MHTLVHSEVINMVQQCQSTCEYTISALLQAPDIHIRGQQFQMLRDCADVCSLTARYISRNSCFAKQLAHLCAQICEACGQHCLQYPDQISQMCGQTCLHCAQVCRQFAGY